MTSFESLLDIGFPIANSIAFQSKNDTLTAPFLWTVNVFLLYIKYYFICNSLIKLVNELLRLNKSTNLTFISVPSFE